MLAGAQWDMLCTCKTSFSSLNMPSVAMSLLCARQSMQNSTPSGNRVSTHTLKTQDNYIFFKQFACTNFQHLFPMFLFFILDNDFFFQKHNTKLQNHSNLLAVIFSPNDDQLHTFNKIICITKENLV